MDLGGAPPLTEHEKTYWQEELEEAKENLERATNDVMVLTNKIRGLIEQLQAAQRQGSSGTAEVIQQGIDAERTELDAVREEQGAWSHRVIMIETKLRHGWVLFSGYPGS